MRPLLWIAILCSAMVGCKSHPASPSTVADADDSRRGDISGSLSWTDEEGRPWMLKAIKLDYEAARQSCPPGYRLPRVAEIKAQELSIWSSTGVNQHAQKGVKLGRSSESVAIPKHEQAAVLCVSQNTPPGDENETVRILRSLEEECGEYFNCDRSPYASWLRPVRLAETTNSVQNAIESERLSRIQDGRRYYDVGFLTTEVEETWVVLQGGSAIGYVVKLADIIRHPAFDGGGSYHIYLPDGSEVADWEWSG